MKKSILLPILCLLCACESGSASTNSTYAGKGYSREEYSVNGYTKDEDKYISLVEQAIVEKLSARFANFVCIGITTTFLTKEENTYYYESDAVYETTRSFAQIPCQTFFLSTVTDGEVTVNSLSQENL